MIPVEIVQPGWLVRYPKTVVFLIVIIIVELALLILGVGR